MANRRSKIMDVPVNPAIMPGLIMLADNITLTGTKALTVTFAAKTVIAVLTSSSADTDAEKVVWAASVSNDVATVTFTATSAGTNNFSYLILATVTETIAANVSTDDLTETPVQ